MRGSLRLIIMVLIVTSLASPALCVPVGEPNESEAGFTPEELDEMQQKEKERIALETLNWLGLHALGNEDIENLPQETIKSLPAINCMAKGLGEGEPLEVRRSYATMHVELLLNELKYYLNVPTGKASESLMEAVKGFQKSIGAKPTGVLLMSELDELRQRCRLLQPPAIRLPPTARVSIYGDFAIVEGTWVFQDGTKHYTPLQTSRIELDRRTKHGVEAIAQVVSFGGTSALLSVGINEWQILRWDADEIVAEDSSPLEMSSTMTVDIKGQHVRMFRCPKGGHEWKPQLLELTDGSKITYDYWEGRTAQARQVMAPQWRKALSRMESLFANPSSEPNAAPHLSTPQETQKPSGG